MDFNDPFQRGEGCDTVCRERSGVSKGISDRLATFIECFGFLLCSGQSPTPDFAQCLPSIC